MYDSPLTRRRAFLKLGSAAVAAGLSGCQRSTEKLVVLTFDDAVRSHRTFVAPVLKELGFCATFFVTHRWMDDRENFMRRREIAELHEMGFEIGNHSWTHADFSAPPNAARLGGELYLVKRALDQVGVPRPVSFAYCGTSFGPEAVEALAELGYRSARRGLPPDAPHRYSLRRRRLSSRLSRSAVDAFHRHGRSGLDDGPFPPRGGRGGDSGRHRRVAVPRRPRRGAPVGAYRTGDVSALHGFPGRGRLSRDRRWRLGAVHRQGSAALGPSSELSREPRAPSPEPPAEVQATRDDLDYWMENMLVQHIYSRADTAQTAGVAESEVIRHENRLRRTPRPQGVRVLSYPGGRQPRTGFLDGAWDPLRGDQG